MWDAETCELRFALVQRYDLANHEPYAKKECSYNCMKPFKRHGRLYLHHANYLARLPCAET